MLALEIEYLTGVIVAARSDDAASVDWPPQPDRVFSALVASWGARGENLTERRALEWLESQEPPQILHGKAAARTVPIFFVPPNDFKTSTDRRFDVIPERRRRQARRFPAARLVDPLVKLVWREDADLETRTALEQLARDTAYVGHSTSLTRCKFISGEFDISESVIPARRVYPGRLNELEREFRAGRRPGPGAVVLSRPVVEDLPSSVFSSEWIVLETGAGSVVPDIHAFAIVARKLRDTLLSGYQKSGGAPPEWLSGHRVDGTPSQDPHLSIIPLADVGWDRASGGLMGCALVLPRTVEIEALVPAIRDRLVDSHHPRRNGSSSIELHYGAREPWQLIPALKGSSASLRVERWLGFLHPNSESRCSTTWRTVTPLVLDRFPKRRCARGRLREITDIVGRACTNIGLPLPAHVEVNDIPFVVGAYPVMRGSAVRPWQRWQLPRSLTGRFLIHASIDFAEPVRGPVIIGAGRFAGLGLCLPREEKTRE